MPIISVIVPVYKVEEYLSRCVDSILAQTFSDFELILVDDGSPDNCGAMCDEYASKEPRIHVIHQKNGGLSAARNSGIEWAVNNSSSEWLSFIDSDDWIHSKYLEGLLNAANTQATDISVCGHQHVNSLNQTDLSNNLEIMSIKLTPENLYLEKFACANMAWGKLYKKNLFEKTRYPLNKLHEDMFVTYRLLFRCDYIACVDSELYYYFDNQQGITKSDWKPARLSVFEAWRKQISFFKEFGSEPLVRQTVCRMIRGYGIHYRAVTVSKLISDQEKKRYIRQLMRELRFYLIKYKKYIGGLKDPYSYYQMAFPRCIAVYRRIKSLKKTG